jgi:putative ATP-dependent endonuclease of OLD family
MAKAKAAVAAAVSLISDDPAIQKPRLIKLIVKNFRCIGTTPVSIDLNDIVVLVGANNVGKSSILKAYELAMSQGSNKGKLKIEDFPNNKIDPDNLPEIELHTIVYDCTSSKESELFGLKNKRHLFIDSKIKLLVDS